MFTADARRALRAWLRLVRIAEPVQLAVLARYGVTFSELHALRILRDLGQVPISRYADALAISRSTATGVVDRFEGRGLVARVASRADRRVILIAITERGRQALEDMTVSEESEPGRRLAALSPVQQRQLVAIAEALTGEPIGDVAAASVSTGQEVLR